MKTDYLTVDMENRTTQLHNIIASFHNRIKKISDLNNDIGITQSEACEIAIRYYPINREFPLLLGSLISRTTNLDVRFLLVKNLYEEHGEENKENAHTKLFDNYAIALGINSNILEQGINDVRTKALLDRFRYSVGQGTMSEALSFFFAYEAVFSLICQQISLGLGKQDVLKREDYKFFSLHAECDIQHADNFAEALDRAFGSNEEWMEIFNNVKLTSNLLIGLFENLNAEKIT